MICKLGPRNAILVLLNIGKGAINEIVYEDPDSLQLQAYLPNNDGDIDLEECPVSDEPSDAKKNFKGQDIKPCAYHD